MRERLLKLMQKKPMIFLDQLIFRIGDDDIIPTGAQLTYFIILSIFPFLILFLNIISYTPLASADVINSALEYLPEDAANILSGFIDDIIGGSGQGLLSLAAIGGIWSASAGVKPMILAINRAYDFEEKRSYFKIKTISILFTLALIGLLLLVVLSLVFGEIIGNKIFELFNLGDEFLTIWTNVRFIIPIIFMVIIFSLLFKYSPSVKDRNDIRFKYTIPGGIFATLGWILASMLFSFYVNNFGNFSVTYGALGGIIVMLIWLYIGSIIILIGGEINATLRYFRLNGFERNKDMSVFDKIYRAL